MSLQNIVLSGIVGLVFFSGIAAADGGGHKEILPDETIIGISLVCTLLTYFAVAKISSFDLDSMEKITASLIMFTIVVHTILGINDLKLLAGAAGFLAFNGAGVGDTAAEGRTAIFFNGTADITEEDGGSILGLMLESGTGESAGSKIVQDTSANENDEIHMEGVDFTIAGSDGTSDILDLTLTGGDDDVNIALEGDTDDHQGGRLVQDTSANENDPFDVEDYTSDIVVYSQAGTSTGTASVLNGVTVAAA